MGLNWRIGLPSCAGDKSSGSGNIVCYAIILYTLDEIGVPSYLLNVELKKKKKKRSSGKQAFPPATHISLRQDPYLEIY